MMFFLFMFVFVSLVVAVLVVVTVAIMVIMVVICRGFGSWTAYGIRVNSGSSVSSSTSIIYVQSVIKEI